jgi:hypothetical protein
LQIFIFLDTQIFNLLYHFLVRKTLNWLFKQRIHCFEIRINLIFEIMELFIININSFILWNWQSIMFEMLILFQLIAFLLTSNFLYFFLYFLFKDFRDYLFIVILSNLHLSFYKLMIIFFLFLWLWQNTILKVFRHYHVNHLFFQYRIFYCFGIFNFLLYEISMIHFSNCINKILIEFRLHSIVK